MINRKAFWISLLVLFVMIAADFWRLSLLPDWRHVPVEGPGSRSVPVFWTFVPPPGGVVYDGDILRPKMVKLGP